MPLLPLEPYVFPVGLLTDSQPSCAQGEAWQVLHTRPRAEKALARRCLERRQSFFLPLCAREKRLPRGIQKSYIPLFAGYVFYHGTREDASRLLETNLIANVLRITDQNGLREDLQRIYRLIQTGRTLTPESRLQPGAQVRVISGPLMGLRGSIIRNNKTAKLTVMVSFLQQGASLEIDSAMVEPA